MHNPTITNANNFSKPLRPSSAHQTVVFSEYPLWFAFFIALFINISEPIFGFTLRNALILKHIPLLIFLPAFTMHIVGRTVARAPRLHYVGWFSSLWPFLLLGIFATLGSLYARFVLDIRETFLILGMYILLTPLFFIWGREMGNTNKVVKPFLFLWGMASVIAVIGSAFYFGKAAVLHNIEFMVQSFFLYFYWVQKRLPGKLFAIILIAAVAILTQKLTGYILGIFSMCYIGVFYLEMKTSKEWISAIRILSVALLLGIVIAAAFGFFYFREYLPSGNMDVRLHQYKGVFSDFLGSPVWGQAYTAESGEVYIEYTRSLNIPTHSDILDLLKQGGIIAIGLWIVGLIVSVRLFIRSAMKNYKTGPYFHSMAFMTISTAIACAINPLLLTPTFAFFIWGSLGLALGVASDTRKGQFNES